MRLLEAQTLLFHSCVCQFSLNEFRSDILKCCVKHFFLSITNKIIILSKWQLLDMTDVSAVVVLLRFTRLFVQKKIYSKDVATAHKKTLGTLGLWAWRNSLLSPVHYILFMLRQCENCMVLWRCSLLNLYFIDAFIIILSGYLLNCSMFPILVCAVCFHTK